MILLRRAGCAAGWLLLMGLAGCTSEHRGSVSGQVKFNGQALDDATINFVPLSGSQLGAAWTKVENGEYSIAAANGPAPGNHRVEIRATRKTGVNKKAVSNPALAHLHGEYEAREIVPARYNTKSDLTAEIKPGKNVADFELKSK
jgi:hypothetical protein